MALDWYLIAREHGYDTPKTMLQTLYHDENLTIAEVAEIVGCSAWAIRYALGHFDVAVKPQGGTRRSKRRLLIRR